jgi:hypothetical protein
MARNAGRDRYIAVAKLRLAGCKVKPSCVSIRYRTAIGYRPASQTLVAMGDHCHYPPGTSKWNKIEHRFFSFISLNWKGEPLINYEMIVNLIGGTKTRTGLKVKAVLDTNDYETGIRVSDEQLEEIRLRRHKVHPAWNYTISPRHCN